VRRPLSLAVLVAVTAALLAPASAEAVTQCHAIAHRMGPTARIDDNTLTGLRRSTHMGARAEVDFTPTIDGLMAFHANRWEQGTTGEGVVWETTQDYARTLYTTPNGQEVPTAAQVLKLAHKRGSRLLIELHRWTYWKPELLDRLVRKLDRLHLWDHVWITGTRGALTALRERVNAMVLWRLDTDADLTPRAATKLDVDMIAVGSNISMDTVNSWRDAGYPISARETPPASWQWAVNNDILTVQTNRAGAWMRFCDSATA
jgi:hypothetical protein